MTRFALTTLIVLSLAIPLVAEPAASLTGVHAVYIRADLSAKRDIARALRSELPQIRLVSRLRDADTVLEFRGIAERTVPPGTMTVSHDQPINYRSDGQVTYETRSETVEVGQPVQVAGHVEGVVVRGGEVKAVLHEGLWTPAFPTQFAARFIRAWREANP